MTSARKTSGKRLWALLRDGMFLAGGIALLFFVFRGRDFSALLQRFSEVNYWWIILGKVIGIGAHWVRGLRWQVLIEPLGYRTRADNTFYAVMIGYLTNIATPKMGELARCWSLNKTDQVPAPALLGTVIVERSVDFLVLILVFGLVFLLNLDLISGFLLDEIADPLKAQFAGSNPDIWQYSFLLIAILVCLAAFLAYRHRSRLSQIDILKRPVKIIHGVISGIKTIAQLKQGWLFIFYTILIWGIYISVFYLNFQAIDATRSLSFLDTFFVFSFGAIAWAVPVQGGIGAYHWIVSSSLVLLGLNVEIGLVFATVVHAAALLTNLIVGGGSLIAVLVRTGKSFRLQSIRETMRKQDDIESEIKK